MKRKNRSIFPNRKWAREARDAIDFLFGAAITILEWFWSIVVFLARGLLVLGRKWKNQIKDRQVIKNISPRKPSGSIKEAVPDNVAEAIEALKSLGVANQYAQKAIEQAVAEVGPRAPVELLIKTGLKHRR